MRYLDVPSTYPLRTLDAQAVPFTHRQTVALPTPLCGPRNHFVGASIAVGNLNPVRQSDSGFRQCPTVFRQSDSPTVSDSCPTVSTSNSSVTTFVHRPTHSPTVRPNSVQRSVSPTVWSPAHRPAGQTGNACSQEGQKPCS